MTWKSRDVRLKTTDNWCPNYDGDEVELSLFKLDTSPVSYRVCVWGEDDCGMEKDFITPNPTKAIRLFNQLKREGECTFQSLKDRGFISA